MGYTARNFRGYLSGLGAAKPTSVVASGNVTAARHVASSFGTAADPAFTYAGDLTSGDFLSAAGVAGTTVAGGAPILISGSGIFTYIPLYVESTFVPTPTAAQSITSAGVAFAPTKMIHEFTATGVYTLTVAPTIATGTDGQLLCLVNVGANAVTVQDQGTLAASNLRLTGATLAIGPRDSVWLYYSGDVGDWVQIGPLVAVV